MFWAVTQRLPSSSSPAITMPMSSGSPMRPSAVRAARAGITSGNASKPTLADSGLTHIARVVRWIRDDYREAFRVEDVARMAGMSV